MRQILTILLSLCCFAGRAQSHDTTGTGKHVWIEKGGTSFQKFLELPLGPSNFAKVDSVGCIYYDTLTGNLMVNDGAAWVPVSGGSGGGGISALSSGYGWTATPNPVTSMGSGKVDTTVIASQLRLTNMLAWYKRINDSLAAEGYVTHAQEDSAKAAIRAAYYPASNPNNYTANTGTVTSVTAGTGLSGGTITSTGTISLPATGTAATTGDGTHVAVITTDAQGRVSNAVATAITFPVTAANTVTFTNKWWQPRVGSATSSATPAINTDNYDIYKLTAQAADINTFSTSLSGSPVDGDVLELQVTGTGAHTITWGSAFVSSTVTLPTAITTATLSVIFQYYTNSSYGNNKWVCVNYY